jgi:predicted Rossmann fold flavoprotein
VEIRLHTLVTSIRKDGRIFRVELKSGEQLSALCLLLASGGSPGPGGMQFLSGLNLELVPPVPSLFTFNVAQHPWAGLMGLSLEDAEVSIPSAGFAFRGPVLVTHWGFSGPAVLKLSAAAALELNACGYSFRFCLDFLPEISTRQLEMQLAGQIQLNPRKKPMNTRLFGIPARLWDQLCAESGLASYHNWAEAGKKSMQKMVMLLKNKTFQASGKTTFKEEFVTAGGVDLETVSPLTCESKLHDGLFFSGEVLNVDGFTGGFNFQAAWSTAYAAAKGIAARLDAQS